MYTMSMQVSSEAGCCQCVFHKTVLLMDGIHWAEVLPGCHSSHGHTVAALQKE